MNRQLINQINNKLIVIDNSIKSINHRKKVIKYFSLNLIFVSTVLLLVGLTSFLVTKDGIMAGSTLMNCQVNSCYTTKLYDNYHTPVWNVTLIDINNLVVDLKYPICMILDNTKYYGNGMASIGCKKYLIHYNYWCYAKTNNYDAIIRHNKYCQPVYFYDAIFEESWYYMVIAGLMTLVFSLYLFIFHTNVIEWIIVKFNKMVSNIGGNGNSANNNNP